MPAMNPADYVPRLCFGCGDMFDGTPKAKRCPTCKADGVKAQPKPPPAPTSTRGKFATTIDQARADFLTDNPLPSPPDPLTVEGYEELKQERRERQWQRNMLTMGTVDQILKARSKKPKGQRKASKEERMTNIYELWTRIVLADGAVNSVLARDLMSTISDADAPALLLSYTRLRFKGYHPDALINLSPTHLLKQDAQAEIEVLPEVTESAEEDDGFDPLEDLDPETRADVEAFMATQANTRDAITLGLVQTTQPNP